MQTAHRETSNPDSEAPWEDLDVTVPTDRDHASVVALVECALVELTHEAVGVVFVVQHVWGTKRTEYIAVDDRLGWHETTVPRQTVRDELITQLTRSASVSAKPNRDAPASDPDTFAVKPVRELQTQ